MLRRPSARGALVVALAALAALGAHAGTVAAAEGPLALAKLSLVERRVELSGARGSWQSAIEGAPLSTGEALRTGPDGTARLELPWMSLTLGPGAALRFPDEAVLSATLDAGRAVVDAPERDALKLVTREAEVYGRGRAVVRRESRVTTVSCLSGRFQRGVGGGRGHARGRPGHASCGPGARRPPPSRCRHHRGRACGRRGTRSTSSAGAPLELRWTGDAAAYQVELLPVGTDVVLIQRDVAAAPLHVEVPWQGAFRWRVSARDARGVEGAPSDEGLIAVE